MITSMADGRELAVGSGRVAPTDGINICEYHGLLYGLMRARTLGIRDLVTKGDSRLICNQVLAEMRCLGRKTATLRRDVWKLTAELRDVEIGWIPRARNTEADKLANQGRDEVQKAQQEWRGAYWKTPTQYKSIHRCASCLGCWRSRQQLQREEVDHSTNIDKNEVVGSTHPIKRIVKIVKTEMKAAVQAAQEGTNRLQEIKNEIRGPIMRKKQSVQSTHDLRLLTLLPSLWNTMASVLIGEECTEATKKHIWQFAYKPSFAALDLAWILLKLTQRANEWGLILYLGSIDIPAAFDNIRHDAMLLAMKSEGIHVAKATWIIQSLRAMTIEPELGELELSPLQMSNGLPQGNKIPTLFTMTLGNILDPLWRELSRNGQGVTLDGLTIPFWFLAATFMS